MVCLEAGVVTVHVFVLAVYVALYARPLTLTVFVREVALKGCCVLVREADRLSVTVLVMPPGVFVVTDDVVATIPNRGSGA